MLHLAKTLKGYHLESRNGEIGKVKEFFFDDYHWTIRYLVAETGDWLTDRQVLISPYALTSVNKEGQSIAVDLTRQQIEDSPTLNTDKPVSRQFEETYYGFYGWPMYWGGSYMWGNYPYILRDGLGKINQGGKAWDSSLRSTHDVNGHAIQASDGEIGHVDDFLIDDETWAIRYLVIDTKNGWSGKKVLISPEWIERVSWDERKVFVNLNLEIIKDAPEFSDELLLTREYEDQLHQHYNRQAYWVAESADEQLSH